MPHSDSLIHSTVLQLSRCIAPALPALLAQRHREIRDCCEGGTPGGKPDGAPEPQPLSAQARVPGLARRALVPSPHSTFASSRRGERTEGRQGGRAGGRRAGGASAHKLKEYILFIHVCSTAPPCLRRLRYRSSHRRYPLRHSSRLPDSVLAAAADALLPLPGGGGASCCGG